MSGKGDVLLGDVVFRKKQADQGDITQRVKRWRSVGGGSPTPMSCWLVSKGLETLRLRMHHATATALEVARFLETVPCLSRVVFPGLASHPCHTRAVKYFGEKNSGAVLRFHICLYGPTVDQMLTDPHPFMHAVSLGESHTLLYPVPGESRLFPEDAEREVPDYVGYWFRVAIGLETAEDIISGFLHLFARQDELVTKVGEVKKFDAKTRQLSFRGKLPSPCPYLFFFAGESDGGKGQKPPSQSTDGQGTRRAIFIERVAGDEAGGGNAAKKGKATVTLGLAAAADEKALLTKGTALFCFKSALTLYTELVGDRKSVV